MSFENNSSLIKQLKSGNEKAFNFLMQSFYKNLCCYAFTLTNDHTKAEDIVQNVFVEVWTKRKNINTNYSIKSFLYKSVYNEFIDQFRKNKPGIYLEKKYLEAIDLVIEKEQRNLDELIKKVNKEIDNLPPKCKQIFLLNKKEGLTHPEIAEYLNISIKTIEGHITRAFKILTEKLDDSAKGLFFMLFKKI